MESVDVCWIWETSSVLCVPNDFKCYAWGGVCYVVNRVSVVLWIEAPWNLLYVSWLKGDRWKACQNFILYLLQNKGFASCEPHPLCVTPLPPRCSLWPGTFPELNLPLDSSQSARTQTQTLSVPTAPHSSPPKSCWGLAGLEPVRGKERRQQTIKSKDPVRTSCPQHLKVNPDVLSWDRVCAWRWMRFQLGHSC